MSLFLGQTYNGEFDIRDATGALAAPASGPTLTVYVDGVSTSTTVTINTTAVPGVYTYSFVIPNSEGGVLSVVLSATLTGSIPISAETNLGVIEDSGAQGGSFSNDASKLGIYNDALRLVGAERLASETEAREVRYKLDEIWDLGAAKHCLRLAKPAFARKVSRLTTATETTEHGIQYEHTLPTDYVALYALYSDENLDERVNRFLQQDGKLLSEFSTVFLRYVSDFSSAVSSWTPDFVRVVSAYLAQQLSARIKPEAYEVLTGTLEQAVEVSMGLSADDEPSQRPLKSLTTLTKEWLPIYNDALQLLGLKKMTTITDERADRVELDTALDSRLVEDLLSDYPWNFARITVRIDRDTALETDFGYTHAFRKPEDMLRLDGVFQDEYCRVPLKNYADEEAAIFSHVYPIYLKYVPDKFLDQPSAWPSHFARYVASQMATQAEPAIPQVAPANRQALYMKHDERRDTARSRDFSQSPPQRINTGSWARARMTGGAYNQRP
ncbi:MAG: hypothetical protein AAFZ74_02130 [Pseudomonadota bacterium]